MEKKVNAIVLRTVDYGENDKMLTLLSAEDGKISAGIKGVRKSGAKLKFAAQPFCLCEYVLSCRGGRNTVINATQTESFYDVRGDILKLYAASSACECAESLSLEGYDCGELFALTVKTLGEICVGDELTALIAYIQNALNLSGYGISAGDCPVCGAPLAEAARLRFDMPSASFTCGGCSEGAAASPSTYAVMRYAVGLSADSGAATPDGERRALKLLREFMRYKTGAKCTSLGELISLL